MDYNFRFASIPASYLLAKEDNDNYAIIKISMISDFYAMDRNFNNSNTENTKNNLYEYFNNEINLYPMNIRIRTTDIKDAKCNLRGFFEYYIDQINKILNGSISSTNIDGQGNFEVTCYKIHSENDCYKIHFTNYFNSDGDIDVTRSTLVRMIEMYQNILDNINKFVF